MDLLRWGFGGGGGGGGGGAVVGGTGGATVSPPEPQSAGASHEMAVTKAGQRAGIHAMAIQNIRAQAAQAPRRPISNQSGGGSDTQQVDTRREESDAGSDTSSEGKAPNFRLKTLL